MLSLQVGWGSSKTSRKRSCIGIPASALMLGKTQVGNAAGERPLACDLLETRASPRRNRGSAFWAVSSKRTSDECWQNMTFCSRASLLWGMCNHRLVSSCIVPGGRANHMRRVVRPEMVRSFAEGHNTGLWTCLCNILNVVVDESHQDVATMPLSLGGVWV